MRLNVFELREQLVQDFADYTQSFIVIRDERIRVLVDEELERGLFWPDPIVQLNPAFDPGETIDELADGGVLHSECRCIFRRDEPLSREARWPVLARRLDGVNPLVYHGSLTQRQKDEVISAFKRSPAHNALVLSLRAGGQGLNLQEASYVFHVDRWWNPAVERQAEDRAHRIGQKNAVTVYRYICEDTIEERIHRILQAKQHLFDEYVDQVTIDPGKLFGEREIFGLLGLEPPPRGGGTAPPEELAA